MTEPSLVATTDALRGLSSALSSAELGLDLDDVARIRASRTELVDQINDYLIPRLSRIDAPLLTVSGGSTGSGKSTITNSLVGREVSPAGVLRPTTRAPVLVCHPGDVAWFSGGEILPELPRVTGEGADVTGAVLRIVPLDSMTAGLAIIDAPDIDSVEETNRSLATQLMAAADLWLFTTTAVRYADAVPWEFLDRARTRGTALAIIVNRIPAGAAGEITGHLRQMLTEAGFGGLPIYPIEDADLGHGLLPGAAVAPISDRLRQLATDADDRARVVAQTLTGALDSVVGRVQVVADASRVQQAAAHELQLALETAYERTRRDLGHDVSNGTLLRGEVLERWQELIGSAELMRAVQSRIAWIRDRIGAFVSGKPQATERVEGEITSTLERLLIDYGDRAALLTADNWRSLPGGRQVLGEDRSLERSSQEFRAAVAPEIRAWQDDIMTMVRERGAGKRTAARALALGVNTVGVTLMIVLFAQTGGLTGGEIAIGAGTAGVSQTLLTALFGEQAVRDLAMEARSRLLDRVGALLASDANRFRLRLWSTVSPPETADDLDTALTRFQRAR
ncbi:MAG: ABC transporter [Acidimicrobiales bacterium]